MLYDAIQVKVHVVQEDPFEQGRRAVLNLGHTFGHAFEKLANFTMRHGEAIAMGVVCAARLATRLGHCPDADTQRIIATLHKVGLATSQPNFAPEKVWSAMFTDKKRQGNTIRFILPRAIGDVDIFTNVPKEDVLAVLG
jgi:3-dehydroquinate synthetase